MVQTTAKSVVGSTWSGHWLRGIRGNIAIDFGLWQMTVYIRKPLIRAALGWGIVLAKASAGVLYQTLFFMLLSLSKHFATVLRSSHWLSKFVNWGVPQAFHIKMNMRGLLISSLHSIGHLTGTSLYGSRPAQQDDVERFLGPDAVSLPYVRCVRSLSPWSEIVALGLFWIISFLNLPSIQKKSCLICQLSHLRTLPMIELLCDHSTHAFFQALALGYWLAFLALLVIFERCWRLARGLKNGPARARVLDTEDRLNQLMHNMPR